MIGEIVYTNTIKKLLVNLRQFENLHIDLNKESNFVLHCEQKAVGVLKVIKNKKKQIDEYQYKKLHSVDSQPGFFYGLATVHKKVIDGFPFFHPRII